MPEKKLSVKRDSKSIQAPPKPTVPEIIDELKDFADTVKNGDIGSLIKKDPSFGHKTYTAPSTSVSDKTPVVSSSGKKSSPSKSLPGKKTKPVVAKDDIQSYVMSGCKAQKGSVLWHLRESQITMNKNVDLNKDITTMKPDVFTNVARKINETGLNGARGVNDFATFTIDLLQDSAVEKAKYDASHDAKGNELPKDKWKTVDEVAVRRQAVEQAGKTINPINQGAVSSSVDLLDAAKKQGLIDDRSMDAALRAKYSDKQVNAIKTGLLNVKEMRKSVSEEIQNYKEPSHTILGGYEGSVKPGTGYAMLYENAVKDVDENSYEGKILAGMSSIDGLAYKAFVEGMARGDVMYDKKQADPNRYVVNKEGVIVSASRQGKSSVPEKYMKDSKGNIITLISSEELAAAGKSRFEEMNKIRERNLQNHIDEQKSNDKVVDVAKSLGDAAINALKSVTKEFPKAKSVKTVDKLARKQIDLSGIGLNEAQNDVQFDD